MALKPNDYIVRGPNGTYTVISNAENMSAEELQELAAKKFAQGDYFNKNEGPLAEGAEEVVEEVNDEQADKPSEFVPSKAGFIGGATGLGVGAFKQVRGVRPQMGYGDLANLPRAGAPAGSSPMGNQPPMGRGAPSAGVAPQASGQMPLRGQPDQVSRILQGTTDDAGTTGRARQTGYNVQTAQEAARVKQAQGVLDQLAKSGQFPVSAGQDPFAKAPGMTASPSGVLYPRSEPARTMGPRASFVQSPSGLTPVPKPQFVPSAPPTPRASPLEMLSKHFADVAQKGTQASRLIGAAAQRLPIVSYPLAGYGIAESGKNLYDLYQEGEYGKMIPEAMVGLGTGLSLAPQTAPVGVPMLGLGLLGKSAIEAGRQREEDPETYYQRIREDVGGAQPILAP